MIEHANTKNLSNHIGDLYQTVGGTSFYSGPREPFHHPTTSTELTTIPPSITSPPAKIPSRPRKIRKVSLDDAAAAATTAYDPKSSQASSTTTTEPTKTTATKTPRTKTAQQRAIVVPRIMARSLTCEGELENAIHHLRNADPLLASLIDVYPPPTFDTFPTPFLALARSILYQQLAFKAGTSIYTRFISLCGGEAGVLPETVLALTAQQLRQIGVSGRKASYLHDLARKYQNGILSDSAIVNMDDKSLFTMLTMVNGIGSWSVHMFMIFSLHRPDVLPINDLQVRKGVQLLYNLPELPRPSQMDQLCEKWRPYRSVASWYLWRLQEVKGSPSSAVAVATSGNLTQQQQEEQQHQQQPQLIDPINSILNLGDFLLVVLFLAGFTFIELQDVNVHGIVVLSFKFLIAERGQTFSKALHHKSSWTGNFMEKGKWTDQGCYNGDCYCIVNRGRGFVSIELMAYAYSVEYSVFKHLWFWDLTPYPPVMRWMWTTLESSNGEALDFTWTQVSWNVKHGFWGSYMLRALDESDSRGASAKLPGGASRSVFKELPEHNPSLLP
ncbi:unnamed protein product [Dovyalis caffra]|uniref:HhH-GPD domain-containing protein n=1 Tax=Dovyalis caffra TaxID=77055 RepID=A0AAV1S4P1_9ROSI|nr:unnamed protein product [Dovyalis caffra]